MMTNLAACGKSNTSVATEGVAFFEFVKQILFTVCGVRGEMWTGDVKKREE